MFLANQTPQKTLVKKNDLRKIFRKELESCEPFKY